MPSSIITRTDGLKVGGGMGGWVGGRMGGRCVRYGWIGGRKDGFKGGV
jgi:hypothetical protein